MKLASLALFACGCRIGHSGETGTVAFDPLLPQLRLSQHELDLRPGLATVTLSNDGELPLGLAEPELFEPEELAGRVEVHWPPADACVSGSDPVVLAAGCEVTIEIGADDPDDLGVFALVKFPTTGDGEASWADPDHDYRALRLVAVPTRFAPETYEPVGLGGIVMDPTSVALGQTMGLSAMAWSPRGQALNWQWSQDGDLTNEEYQGLHAVEGQFVDFTAPLTLYGAGSEQQAGYSAYTVITDEDGNQEWVFDEVAVRTDPLPLRLSEL